MNKLDEETIPSARSRWFSPVQMLEVDACSRCQECVAVCPVVSAGVPDGAMERIARWREAGTRSHGLLARLLGRPLSRPELTALFDSLFRCTSCGACEFVCESAISTPALWESMRGAGRDLGFRDPSIERSANSIARERNPYGMPPESRTAWIPPGTRIAESAPVAFFAGCTIAFWQPDLGRAALRILARSGTEFCMLGNDESCCGSFLFRTGAWKEYPDTILAMIRTFEKRGVKTVLFSCAGCLKTATVDWPQVYGRPLPFEVVSFSVFLRDCIRNKTIQFTSPLPRRVAYHDPCHGARHLMKRLGRDRVFEAPRDILTSIPGLELSEFPENREFSVCCGAGGGVKTGDPGLAATIAHEKIAALDRMGAGILASTCPFCRRNLDDARIASGSQVEVLDVIELADRMMDS